MRRPDQNTAAKYELPKLIAEEFTSLYKRYAVKRKMPRLMGRVDLDFVIDGDFVYLRPLDTDGGTKSFFESVKPVIII